MRSLNNFFSFGEPLTTATTTGDGSSVFKARLGGGQSIKLLQGRTDRVIVTESSVGGISCGTSSSCTADREGTGASDPSCGQEMSRRKQCKPRHLDSEDGDQPTSSGGGEPGNSECLTTGQLEHPEGSERGIKGLNPDLGPTTSQEPQQEKSMSEGPSSSSPAKSFDSDMPTLHRHDLPPQHGQDSYFGSPTHRLTKLNRGSAINDTKRAVVSPLPRTPSKHESNVEHMIQQPVAPSITPAEMERHYFQNIAAAARASAVAAAAVATSTNGDHMRKEEYSDDDDVPSDIESCANESELQEELEKPQEHPVTPSASSKYTDQDETKRREKQPEKMAENEGEEESEYIDVNSSSTAAGAVKLKALETTNVAVAQVVENNNNEVREQLPNLQQVLFTLHQQQMFQLQVLQQIQQQVTKIAHHDGDLNGLKDDATAALFSMMGRGLPQAMQSSGSDDSCGADDISEGSIGSAEGQLAENSEEPEQPQVASSPFESHKSRGPIHEYISPAGSPEPDNDGSTGNTSGSMEEELRKPAFPGDNEECFKDMPPVSRHMPPIPYLGGLGGHMMPGNVNPLLPSNMFGMPSPMQGPGSMGPGRFPMFRSPVMPRQDEDETLEEFMEIDTSDATKLEEFMKKVEPTLKDPNQCAVCKKVLSCKSALQMHYRTHTGSRPFKCKICSRAFTTKGNLKTHMSVHRSRPTGPSLHQCPVCSKKFNSVLHLQEHMRMHIGEVHSQPMPKHPMMPMLPQGFMPFMNYPLVPPSLPQDKKPDFSGNFSVSKESKDLNSSFERKSPISSVEPMKRPPVDSVEELRQKRQKTDILEPPKMERDRPYLTPEKNIKSDNEHSSPDIVNPYSASLLALEESVKEMDKKMAESSNFFIKTEDSKTFMGSDKHSESLQSKDMTVNGTRDDLHSRLESVQTSVITQVPTSQHKAPVSGPVISLPPSQSVSNSQSPPSCPTSPFSSGRRQSLRHVCSVCHKPFSSSSALQIHMRTHTGERPFKCNVCDKAFTTKGNLKVHMGTHAIVTGPPRRGRRMSMENLPPFSSPGQFPPVMPRPPIGMFPSFPYSNMFLPGKGLPFVPPVGLMPGSPMGVSMFAPRKDGEEKESSLSPTSVMDLHKASDSNENNNGPSKGIHGELDLSIRTPNQQAIKT